ncbi:MAG: DUF3047 domain-containing protein [Betaproteobacteria bacterium]|nr:DUF3047 domain-containing protein [Betaproteobacteria bacterium]
MSRRIAVVVLAVAGSLTCVDAANEQAAIVRFSSAKSGDPLPAPWKLVTLAKIKKPTRYSLVLDADKTVLRADADASMASVMHPLHFDPRDHPVVEWRWKIAHLLRKSNIATKAGDDFPARFYVLFDYDIARLPFATRAKIRVARALFGEDVPLAVLCYVWDGKSIKGAATWSPYTDRVRIIVAESGEAHLNQWVTVRRNIVDDFRAAFGEDPPQVTGVAVATDTDNTGESAVAFYGDIRFLKSVEDR